MLDWEVVSMALGVLFALLVHLLTTVYYLVSSRFTGSHITILIGTPLLILSWWLVASDSIWYNVAWTCLADPFVIETKIWRIDAAAMCYILSILLSVPYCCCILTGESRDHVTPMLSNCHKNVITKLYEPTNWRAFLCTSERVWRRRHAFACYVLQPCSLRDWELHVHFRVHGKSDLFGDGFAIWYTKDLLQLGKQWQLEFFDDILRLI